MRAVVRDRYGDADALRVETVPDPTPRKGEVVVRMDACSINQWDHLLLTGKPWINRVGAVRYPRQRVLGSDVAGEVVAVGNGVTRFRVGDQVVGELSSFGFGGFAELVRGPEVAFVTRPDGVPADAAAASPQAGTIALQALLQSRVSQGGRVLVNGAGGGAGSFAVQLARSLGAAHVTAVDAGVKLAALRDLGADEVIDFQSDDWTRSDDSFDAVVDFEAWLPIHRVRRRLARSGRYTATGGSLKVLARALVAAGWTAATPGGRITVLAWKPHRHEDMSRLLASLHDHETTAVIDSTYALADTADAFRRFASGQFVGKVVVTGR